MATAAMAHGEIQIPAREGRSVPLGTGLDAEGRPTTDPNEVLKGCCRSAAQGLRDRANGELLAAGAMGERFSFERVRALA